MMVENTSNPRNTPHFLDAEPNGAARLSGIKTLVKPHQNNIEVGPNEIANLSVSIPFRVLAGMFEFTIVTLGLCNAGMTNELTKATRPSVRNAIERISTHGFLVVPSASIVMLQ